MVADVGSALGEAARDAALPDGRIVEAVEGSIEPRGSER
jgi:hypothetical protein